MAEGIAEGRHASGLRTPDSRSPSRALSNVKFNPKRAIIEMGDRTSSRA